MKRGQTTLEYVFLIGIVGVAVTAMLVYINRGFQGNVRASADQIGAGHYEPGNATILNNQIKQVSFGVTSLSVSTTTYGTGGAESQDMQDNRAAQEALRAELEILEQARTNTTGNSVLVNQAAIAAAGRISGVDTSAIEATISAANRATTLAGIDNATSDLNTSLGQLQTAYTRMERSRNELRDADYGCDGMPDSVRQDIADLEADMAENLEYQADIREKIAELARKRREVVDTGTAGISTTEMTPEYRAQMLAQVDLQLAALSTQYQPLSNEYVILQNNPSPTSAERDRMLVLEREMEVIQGRQAELQASRQRWASAGNLGTDVQTITPEVTPVVTPLTLEEIEERIGEINGELTTLAALYTANSIAWNNRVIVPDATTSTSLNTEKGASSIYKTTNEILGDLPD